MVEWIDPRYAEVVEAMRQAAEGVDPESSDPVPMRGFIIPPKD
ncbi:hypothetical protein [Streptomyces sp. SID3212]|nr:hypothetical protein [Streptomyces sp. SID3212]